MELDTGVTAYVGAILQHTAAGNKAELADDSRQVIGIASEYGVAGDTIIIEAGQYERFTFTGAALGDIGKAVYPVDDETVTTTAGTNVVGYIVDVPATNTVLVHVTTHA